MQEEAIMFSAPKSVPFSPLTAGPYASRLPLLRSCRQRLPANAAALAAAFGAKVPATRVAPSSGSTRRRKALLLGCHAQRAGTRTFISFPNLKEQPRSDPHTKGRNSTRLQAPSCAREPLGTAVSHPTARSERKYRLRPNTYTGKGKTDR